MSTVYNKLIDKPSADTSLRYAFQYANDNPDNMVASHHMQNIAQELDNSNRIYADTQDIDHG
ncbi:MAG: hypothetical protein CBB97_10155, partial [Candidatus Endolissoclinum sp. TMED37]